MAEPIRFDKSGFNQAEKIRRQGQTSLVLVNGLGAGPGGSGVAPLVQAAVTSTTSADALRADAIIQEQLQGSAGPELLRRLAPQLANQQAAAGLLTGGGFTPQEQANLIAGSLKSLTGRGGFLNLQA
ncbi:MAG: hypothetical protein A3J27_01845 [Candidatus Tectomicrobia bacterium RIFCSPLOWO2_12_FULL_69_37]|nr:MAG: hypothetical protein A3J27_01845 [Candidatus Tectomicrobia bacterium RIFCSPLOWO2_12_FULL_69_37]OGL58939.1 MAG: hypothetical protein A3I72_15310 [Candidatus Tectomicrobia bacterium RIFCSPLOWO2_02_FULL_70_19]